MKNFFWRYVTFSIALFLMVVSFSGCTLKRINKKEYYEIEMTETQSQQMRHTHNWSLSFSDMCVLEETVELQSVASEGIDTVYLIRDVEIWGMPEWRDCYIVYDKSFKDIVVRKWPDNEIVIGCITDGVPRMEKYSVSKSCCTICGEYSNKKGEVYKFYIPEGTYLISH